MNAVTDIGIDLGTTFSVIAVCGRVELAAGYPPGKYLPDCDVTIIPTPDGEETFPSVVMRDPAEPDNPRAYLFGRAALQEAEEGLAPVMFSKRKIGTRERIPVADGSVLARDVAREFLAHLKHCAEQALGRPVRRAVITHPAYFDRSQVEETRQAAAEAGFDMGLPEQMLMEPAAAALSYTRADKRDPLLVVTYDLGGGTFDVTVLERRQGLITIKAFDGDHLLGGYNLDRELVHWLRKGLEAKGRPVFFREDDAADRGRLARLLRLAEAVKIALADARTDSEPIEFRVRGVLRDGAGRDVQANERITRAQFVGLIRPFLDRTVECCRSVLAKAGVSAEAVDEFLLVGGSAYGPWVREALVAAFPSATPRLFHPDLCVGAGAAVHAKMVLPRLLDGARYRLTLDAPETSSLEYCSIAGRVAAAGDRDGAGDSKAAAPAAAPLPPLAVRLSPAGGGAQRGPAALDAAGRFLFEGVELLPDGPTRMSLSVLDRSGAPVLEHDFQVTYAPTDTDASGVTTVLPKPIYVETADGLVALAQEGVPLPARVEQSFRRENDNPNISLRLFQERDPIGEIRIENIPDQAGRGSRVDLVIEVTDKNQIRGTATVRADRDPAKVFARSTVNVRFEPPEVPAPDALAEQLEELRGQYEEQFDDGDDDGEGAGQVAAELDGDSWGSAAGGNEDTGEEADEDTDVDVDGGSRSTDAARRQTAARLRALLAEADRLFEQQPLERQEIVAVLRALRSMLNPPDDEMTPTRAEFCQTADRCRRLLHGLAAKARVVLEQAGRGIGGAGGAIGTGGNNGGSLDAGLVENAKATLQKAGRALPTVDKLEAQGLAAHDRRDRRAWARVADTLEGIVAQFREMPKLQKLPTALMKFMVNLELMRDGTALEEAVERVRARGQLADWQGEIDRIRHGLRSAMQSVEQIHDSLDPEQARARMAQLFHRTINPLKESVRKVSDGVVISKL